jgi:hypothetical protein
MAATITRRARRAVAVPFLYVTKARSGFNIAITEPPANAPTDLVANAALLFASGGLAEFALGGFGVWQQPDGTRSVSWPTAQFHRNGSRQRWRLLRAQGANPESREAAVAALILAAYEAATSHARV